MPECAHRTTRASGVCKQCAIERKFEGLDHAADEYQCKNAGCRKGVSAEDTECHWCRGAGDECERCGTKNADLSRTPVIDVGPMTLCPDCETYLDGKGRLPRAVCDGGEDPLGIARMHLVQAATRSHAGEVLSTMQHLETAGEYLRRGDRNAIADVVDDIREGDVCHSQVSFDLRQLAQFLDVDETPTYHPASEVAR